jgi:hypothetical protein
MWTHEHTADTPLPAPAVWAVLADLDGWARWDTSMERVRLLGPFRVGSQVSMTPHGQPPIVSTITAIRENEHYADETAFEGVTLRFSHTLSPLPAGGTRITHRLEIAGATADEIGPGLGPAITEDFPEAMTALLEHAAAAAA